jgi:EAL domain-containing protein (putative c-di-GMP-specific phosphodiesterase class I)/ActR/RegA family two-component response regulator
MTNDKPSAERQLLVLLDDDVMITEGLAAGLEREGRSIITCNDVESAELVVERMRPSHIIADIRLSGPFGYEGLDFIRFAKRVVPESRVILISGDGAEALQLEASERGAVAFLKKPFDVAELDAMLDLLHSSALSGHSIEDRVIRTPLLDDILQGQVLFSAFQPVVELASPDRPAYGYEALARCRTESLFRSPELLFQYAIRKDRVADLEAACMARALRSAAALPEHASLFLNIHPHVFASGGAAFVKNLLSQAARSNIAPRRLVLEITEQGSLTKTRALLDTVTELREAGVRFAFDDVGVAYSHLPLIDVVRPSFLKVSQHFGTGFEIDATRTKIVTNLLSLANDFGCELILEGVEESSTAAEARHLGIRYGQGFLFGRPAEA